MCHVTYGIHANFPKQMCDFHFHVTETFEDVLMISALC